MVTVMSSVCCPEWGGNGSEDQDAEGRFAGSVCRLSRSAMDVRLKISSAESRTSCQIGKNAHSPFRGQGLGDVKLRQ